MAKLKMKIPAPVWLSIVVHVVVLAGMFVVERSASLERRPQPPVIMVTLEAAVLPMASTPMPEGKAPLPASAPTATPQPVETQQSCCAPASARQSSAAPSMPEAIALTSDKRKKILPKPDKLFSQTSQKTALTSRPHGSEPAMSPDTDNDYRQQATPPSSLRNESVSAQDGVIGAMTAPDLEEIKRRISNHLIFPPFARRMGWKGSTLVSFHLLADGSVQEVEVKRSSGKRLLDSCVAVAVSKAAPFPAPPHPLVLQIPVVFSLR